MEKSHYIGIIAALVLLNLLVFSCQNDKTAPSNHTEVVEESTTDTHMDAEESSSEDETSEKTGGESTETADADTSNENTEKAEEEKEEEASVAKNETKEKPATMSTPAAPPRTKTKKPKKPAQPVAKFKFDKKEHNFGTVEVGTKVEHDFYFTNSGDVPLVITDASSTCGCTIPEVPKEPIPPGGRSKVKVTFDSTGKIGMQDKHVTIVANTYPKNTVIHMKGLALTSNMMPKKKTTTTASPSPYSSPKISQPATTTPPASENPVKKEMPVKDEGSEQGGNSSLMSTTDKPSEAPAAVEKTTIDNKDQ